MIKLVLITALLVLAIVVLKDAKPNFACRRKRYRYRIKKPVRDRVQPARGFRNRKPAWTRHAVLILHAQCPTRGCRALADEFNRLYLASTGISVGKTWVSELLKETAYEALHRQRALKHRVPPPLPCNAVWGIDTTCVRDADDQQHVVLGMIDHGSRVSLALRPLRRFNAWALLGCLFLAIGQFGRPKAVRCDNHPVFRAKQVRRVLRWAGVRMQFSEPGKPWQNGRIERFFGTFKSHLHGYVMRDSKHLMRSLADFQFWYNTVRPHRHLGGATPVETWHGIDPYRHTPKKIVWFETWEGRLNGWILRQ